MLKKLNLKSALGFVLKDFDIDATPVLGWGGGVGLAGEHWTEELCLSRVVFGYCC